MLALQEQKPVLPKLTASCSRSLPASIQARATAIACERRLVLRPYLSPQILGSTGVSRMNLLIFKKWLLLSLTSVWIMPAYGQTAADTNAISTNAINTGESITQMMLGLLAVIAMIFALIWLLKKVGYQGYHNNQHMKITACLPLSAKEKLMLVEVGQQQLLIGVGPGFVNHIANLDQQLDQNDTNHSKESVQSVSSLFADKLKVVLNKGEAVE